MATAALKRKTHPNTLKALAENRARTQFNGPDAPPRCAKDTCNRFAWGKSPTGLCWFHSGAAKSSEPRNTPYGQAKRLKNQGRRVARKMLDEDPPSPQELRHAATLVPKLVDRYDRPHLELLVRDVMRGNIDHRAYRTTLRLLTGET